MRDTPHLEPFRALPAPAVALLAFLPLVAWIEASRALLPGALEGMPHGTPGYSPATLVTLALAVSFAGVAAEALFWRACWGARGVAVPYGSLLFALWVLSTIDACASALVTRGGAGGTAGLWLAPWVGYRALRTGDAASSGWQLAFASTGLLTAARVSLSAWAQARLADRRWREAFVGVAFVWLASHVALAWIFELVRGRAIGPR